MLLIHRLYRRFLKLYQFFMPHRGAPVPGLIVIEWECMPWNFRVDWFASAGSDLSNRVYVERTLDLGSLVCYRVIPYRSRDRASNSPASIALAGSNPQGENNGSISSS